MRASFYPWRGGKKQYSLLPHIHPSIHSFTPRIVIFNFFNPVNRSIYTLLKYIYTCIHTYSPIYSRCQFCNPSSKLPNYPAIPNPKPPLCHNPHEPRSKNKKQCLPYRHKPARAKTRKRYPHYSATHSTHSPPISISPSIIITTSLPSPAHSSATSPSPHPSCPSAPPPPPPPPQVH